MDKELRLDCLVREQYLKQPTTICHPCIDFTKLSYADELNFYTDTAKSDKLGFGGVFGTHWMKGNWIGFVGQCNPSIEYLELYALIGGEDLWASYFSHRRVIFCDNESVVHMVNQTTAKCEIQWC